MLQGTFRRLFVALGVGGLLSVGACGVDDSSSAGDAVLAASYDELVAAAKDEGSVTIYSAESPELLDAVGAAFEEKYGITVKYVRLANSAILQRYAAERSARTVAADVLQISDPNVFKDSPEWFHPVADLPIPAVEGLRKKYVHEYYVDTSIFPSSIQYNTEDVPGGEPPASWQDLLAPEYKGKILLVDPRATISSLGLLEMLREEYGDEYLAQLGRQDLDFVDSASPGAQKVAAGVYPVNLPGSGGGQVAPLKENGAPVDYTVLSPTVWNSNKLTLSEGSAHPNAGALYMDFRLSREGIEVVCDLDTQIASPLPETLAGCVDLPSGARPVDYSLSKDQAAIDTIEELIGR